MTPLEPIPETAEAAAELRRTLEDPDLLADLTRLGARAPALVPDLVGVSVARLQERLTFTLVATSAEVAVLDGIQYVAGGPCVAGGERVDPTAFTEDDVLDEERWRLFAAATAARAVRSTLTLPVVRGHVVGTVNLYAASAHAFEGHREALAAIFGAWAEGAVANADLSFTTRSEAVQAPARIRDQAAIDVAVGILVAEQDLDRETAAARLRDAARRAGVSAAELARTIVRAAGGENGGEAGA